MVNDLEQLKERYKLLPEQFEKIGKTIIRRYAAGITPEKIARVVILGGQPGAGETELTTEALKFLGDNTVVCNADEYRIYHPQHKEINKKHEDQFPDITSPYSKGWNDLLKEYCIENKLNFVLETTFTSGDDMNETITYLKTKGFEVTLMVLAVNCKLSFLGVLIRYEDMFVQDGYGRKVNKKQHDDRYALVSCQFEIVG